MKQLLLEDVTQLEENQLAVIVYDDIADGMNVPIRFLRISTFSLFSGSEDTYYVFWNYLFNSESYYAKDFFTKFYDSKLYIPENDEEESEIIAEILSLSNREDK